MKTKTRMKKLTNRNVVKRAKPRKVVQAAKPLPPLNQSTPQPPSEGVPVMAPSRERANQAAADRLFDVIFRVTELVGPPPLEAWMRATVNPQEFEKFCRSLLLRARRDLCLWLEANSRIRAA